MKIGIVTHPLCNNYGGILQNYALQYVIKKLGHEVKTIDFAYRTPYTRYILSICKQILIGVINLRKPQIPQRPHVIHKRNLQMDVFVNKYIKTTEIVHSYSSQLIKREHFDAVIVGSDQVWRPQYNYYIEDMFLKFVPSQTKKIAYGASFGVDMWEYDKDLEIRCKKLISRFSSVSVREKSGVELCREFLSTEAQWVLDPTILAGQSAYLPLINKYSGKPYLFAYILDITKQKIEYINSIAQLNNLEVKICSAEMGANLSIEEWLSAIVNSTKIITDSFHGTVFSIIFHKDFYSIVNKQRGGTRFNSLLSSLNLEDRMIDIDNYNSCHCKKINWLDVETHIDAMRHISLLYLQNSLIY